jgi:hypothetical protein
MAEKASFMTDPSTAPEQPDVAETASFLRRFADLMSTGYNATYLHRAADLLETQTARVTAAVDEEQLWRYKYETAIQHADALEAECDGLKHDIDGHLDITTSLLSERDSLKATLQGRETELAELGAALNREQLVLAAQSEAHEKAVAEFHAGFDRERDALMADATARGEELDQLRGAFEREREALEATVEAGQKRVAELGLGLERERAEFQTQLKVREDELAALRAVYQREHDALREKVASLEAKRAELRSTFERIGDLQHQTIEHQAAAGRSVSATTASAVEATPLPAQPAGRGAAFGETDAVVPKTMLRQARAQFEYLAKECISRGDIATQVMCELGAYTMDIALTGPGESENFPVGEVALSILAPARSSVIAGPM